MKKPILVVMAAGMGSRYGGMKQIDPVGPNGEIIIDYSLYDADEAGFGKVVFIIKEENRKMFEEALKGHIPSGLETVYAYQKLEDIPENAAIPEGRVKPWGTAHAVYSARNFIDAPFAVINADDYYGKRAFKLMADYLIREDAKDSDYAMVAYELRNTLTENGSVSRGVCEVENGKLKEVVERTKIFADEDSGKYTEDGVNFVKLPKETYVSMNFWGFQPNFIEAVEEEMQDFFVNKVKGDSLKSECYLPSVVMRCLNEGKAEVEVLTTTDRWMGVTYKEDKAHVAEGFKKLIENGIYPKKLWE